MQGNISKDDSQSAEFVRLTSELDEDDSENAALENLQKASVYNTNVSQLESRVQAQSETEEKLKEKERVQKKVALQKEKVKAKIAKVTETPQELAQLRDNIAEKESQAEEHVTRKAKLKELIHEKPEYLQKLEVGITEQYHAAKREIAEVSFSAKMDMVTMASKHAKVAATERLKALVTSDAEEVDFSDVVEEAEQKVAEAQKVVNEASALIEKGNTEEEELRQKIEEVYKHTCWWYEWCRDEKCEVCLLWVSEGTHWCMAARAWKEAARSVELERALVQREDLKTVQVMDTESRKVIAVMHVRDSVRIRMTRQCSAAGYLNANRIESVENLWKFLCLFMRLSLNSLASSQFGRIDFVASFRVFSS